MDFNQVVERLISKPKYMTNGAGHLSKLFNCSKEDVYKAKKVVYGKIKLVDEPIKKMPKILILDIETAPMKSYTWGRWKQNVSLSQTISEFFMLSWAAKWLYSPVTMSMSVTPEDARGEYDGHICLNLWTLMDEADIIIAHNGNSFDVPKINSRFIVNNLPPTSPYQTIDTLLVARKQFGFSSNKLDALAGYFGVEHKMETGFELWSKCMDGDAESLKYMETYNRKDVEILEEVYLNLRPWIKNHPNVSLFNELSHSQCTCCGSSHVKEVEGKYYYTSVGAYPVYRCMSCGGLSRGRKTVIAKSKNKQTLTSIGK
jgi:hypothetical protein